MAGPGTCIGTKLLHPARSIKAVAAPAANNCLVIVLTLKGWQVCGSSEVACRYGLLSDPRATTTRGL
jgi:hypothetical protein